MISTIQKTTFFLSLSFIALQSVQAMDPEGKYWNDFTDAEKEVVYSYNRLRNVKDKLPAMSDNTMSAPYCEEMGPDNPFRSFKEEGENLLLDVLNTTFGSLQISLAQANFPDHRTTYISPILQKSKDDLTAIVTPIQNAYNALKRKESPIEHSDAEAIQKDIATTIGAVTAYFPSNIENIKKLLFPDYMGIKRPINPEIPRNLDAIEADMNERKALAHNETVMAYGEVLAPKYLPFIIKTLPELIELRQKPASLYEIGPWLNNLKVSENLDRDRIREAIYNVDQSPLDLTMTSGLKPREVWELTYRLVRTVYEQKDDEGAKNLLLTYGIKLEEQGNACYTGGIGRNFYVLAQAYKLLIERQSM